jgi:glycogen phosphorylase
MNVGRTTRESAGGEIASLEKAILCHAHYSLGKVWDELSPRDRFAAVAMAIRDRLLDLHLETERRYCRRDPKRLYYISMEFLIGQSLASNLYSLGIRESCRQALCNLGVDL